MVFLEALCDNLTVLKVIMFINKVLGVLFWLIPMILIVMASIDLARSVISREDEMSKYIIHVIQRVIIAVFIFLLPNVINLFNSIVDNTSFSACMKNADSIYVKNLELSKATKESLEKINSPYEVDLSVGSKSKVVKAKKRKKKDSSSNTSSGLTKEMLGVILNGELPEGDEYYPLDGKNKKGKDLTYLEIDGKYLDEDEQKEMKQFIKSAIKSSNDYSNRVALAAWSLIYGLYKKGLKMHYFKGNRTWGTNDTVDPVGTCNSRGWCQNWGRFASASRVAWAINGYGYVNAQGDAGKSKYYTGMGCDGFVRWAQKSACGKDLYGGEPTHNRTYDYTKAKTGDPMIGPGHSRLVIKNNVSKRYILTAEATSGGAGIGLFFHKYSYSSLRSDNYQIILMTENYPKYCTSKVNK